MTGEPTIFVVDDDPAACNSVARSLSKRGYRVEKFLSAQAFLDDFGAGRPGCLVLDFGMPDMNGLELQAHLAEAGHLIPIIFVTGHGGIPESVQATKAGAVDFLEKPYVPQVLQDRIEVALAQDRIERAKDRTAQWVLVRLKDLTKREREIFDYILAHPTASSSKMIARAFGSSPRTIDIHRTRILQKTACKSVVELLEVYRELAAPAGADRSPGETGV